MASLPLTPTVATTETTETKTLESNFGDSYTQRTGDGINTVVETWSVTFAGLDSTNTLTIRTFFEGLEGYQYFTWTPPGRSTERKFVCKTWSENYHGANRTTVTASFRQVFDRS